MKDDSVNTSPVTFSPAQLAAIDAAEIQFQAGEGVTLDEACKMATLDPKEWQKRNPIPKSA